MAKLYTITRVPQGALHLLAEAVVPNTDARGRRIPGTHVEQSTPVGSFDIGNASDGTKALATEILKHYYAAKLDDAPAMAEVGRKVLPFLEAFLEHHKMKPGSRLEISSDVIDLFFYLHQ